MRGIEDTTARLELAVRASVTACSMYMCACHQKMGAYLRAAESHASCVEEATLGKATAERQLQEQMQAQRGLEQQAQWGCV